MNILTKYPFKKKYLSDKSGYWHELSFKNKLFKTYIIIDNAFPKYFFLEVFLNGSPQTASTKFPISKISQTIDYLTKLHHEEAKESKTT